MKRLILEGLKRSLLMPVLRVFARWYVKVALPKEIIEKFGSVYRAQPEALVALAEVEALVAERRSAWEALDTQIEARSRESGVATPTKRIIGRKVYEDSRRPKVLNAPKVHIRKFDPSSKCPGCAALLYAKRYVAATIDLPAHLDCVCGLCKVTWKEAVASPSEMKT